MVKEKADAAAISGLTLAAGGGRVSAHDTPGALVYSSKGQRQAPTQEVSDTISVGAALSGAVGVLLELKGGVVSG